MTTTNLQVRRATVEDLQRLAPLWQQEHLSVSDLEKRFKEFQVIEAVGGELLGAIGFELAGPEGRLHSEVFAHADQSNALREKLWERAQVLASNHGLARLWTQLPAPFWQQNGFLSPSAETAAKKPAGFTGDARPWLCLQLKDESAPVASLDKEFALFKESERETTNRLFRQARVMKVIAAVVAFVVFFMVIVWAFYFFKLQKRPPGP